MQLDEFQELLSEFLFFTGIFYLILFFLANTIVARQFWTRQAIAAQEAARQIIASPHNLQQQQPSGPSPSIPARAVGAPRRRPNKKQLRRGKLAVVEESRGENFLSFRVAFHVTLFTLLILAHLGLFLDPF